MDITGLQSIEEMIENFHKKNVQVLISGANTRVAMKLKKAGIVDLVGEDNFFSQFDDALSVSLQRLNISTTQ